jgi:hypothetical protein
VDLAYIGFAVICRVASETGSGRLTNKYVALETE